MVVGVGARSNPSRSLSRLSHFLSYRRLGPLSFIYQRGQHRRSSSDTRLGKPEDLI